MIPVEVSIVCRIVQLDSLPDAGKIKVFVGRRMMLHIIGNGLTSRKPGLIRSICTLCEDVSGSPSSTSLIHESMSDGAMVGGERGRLLTGCGTSSRD